MSKKKVKKNKKAKQVSDNGQSAVVGTERVVAVGNGGGACIDDVALHLARIHNEFSAKLRTLQQTANQNRQTTIIFSRALYQFVRPLRAVAFLMVGLVHPVRQMKILRDWLYIYRSGAFDTSFYLRVYPDVAAGAFNPILHFCCHGWPEKRNPSSHFVTAKYMRNNPDVVSSGMNPFYHYLRYGQKEDWRKMVDSDVVDNTMGRVVGQVSIVRISDVTNEGAITGERLIDVGDRISAGLYGSV